MSDNLNLVSQNNKNLSAILASESVQNKFEGDNQKNLGEELIKESAKHTNNSKAQAEQAREYLSAADSLEKMAQAVRVKAEQLRNNELKKEDTVKAVSEVVQGLEMPVPKNATPEQLERMAEDLEAKAKENRRKADDLLQNSEESEKMASKLKEQAELVNKKDSNLSALRLKSVSAHTEGLSMVFKKLGIYNVDMQYKEQIAYASRKSAEKGLS